MQCRRLFDNINLLLLRLKYALKVFIYLKKYDVRKVHSTAKIALFVTKASVSEGNIYIFYKEISTNKMIKWLTKANLSFCQPQQNAGFTLILMVTRIYKIKELKILKSTKPR